MSGRNLYDLMRGNPSYNKNTSQTLDQSLLNIDDVIMQNVKFWMMTGSFDAWDEQTYYVQLQI